MPRIHLFELEDQAWFPRIIRDFATDYLHFMERRFRLHEPVVPLLRDALRESGSITVVDLCAGGGGPIADLQRDLAAQGVRPRFILTDRFPNLAAFERIAAEHPGIDVLATPVDATDVPATLRGFRTVFNAFHHFAPDQARAILRSAVTAGQPIGIFEVPERRVWLILATPLLTTLLVLLVTPFIRPFRWSRLVFTYLVPLVPLTCAWDGFVSQLRAYTPAELDALAAEAGDPSYEWRSGKVRLANSPAHLTWLIGLPRRSAA
ncbi:MAG: class I SAM-dependent methyltransferase [Gemmatimonadaceae bacterium]|nr:class I SAM-dependent methyltransferase [Gemmatimonadaceae bacterium]